MKRNQRLRNSQKIYSNIVPIRKLAKLIDHLGASFPAVTFGPLFIDTWKNQTLLDPNITIINLIRKLIFLMKRKQKFHGGLTILLMCPQNCYSQS